MLFQIDSYLDTGSRERSLINRPLVSDPFVNPSKGSVTQNIGTMENTRDRVTCLCAGIVRFPWRKDNGDKNRSLRAVAAYAAQPADMYCNSMREQTVMMSTCNRRAWTILLGAILERSGSVSMQLTKFFGASLSWCTMYFKMVYFSVNCKYTDRYSFKFESLKVCKRKLLRLDSFIFCRMWRY